MALWGFAVKRGVRGVSRGGVLYCVMSCQALSCPLLDSDVHSSRRVSCHFMPCHVVLCRVVSRLLVHHIMSFHVRSCKNLLCECLLTSLGVALALARHGVLPLTCLRDPTDDFFKDGYVRQRLRCSCGGGTKRGGQAAAPASGPIVRAYSWSEGQDQCVRASES